MAHEAAHPNFALLMKLDLQNLDACAEVFADDFIWHYFNPKLPDFEGDYRGVEGLKGFFAKLSVVSRGRFQVDPIDVRAVGDELLVTHVRNRIGLGEGVIEFDAVVVWRIVNGKLAEAWDIPSVYNVRTV